MCKIHFIIQMLNAYLQHSNGITLSNNYCHNLTYWFFTMDCSRSTYYFVIVLLSVNLILLPYNFSVFASPANFLSNIHYTPGMIYYQFCSDLNSANKKSIKTFYDIWTSNMQANQRNPFNKTHIRLFLNSLLKHEYR